MDKSEPEIQINCHTQQEHQESTKKTGNKEKALKKKNKRNKVHKMISSTYRKKQCQHYRKGACNKGDLCTFSHNFVPDVAQKMCKYFLSNSCSKRNCPYSHNTEKYPCKFYHLQKQCLQGEKCRFSHESINPDIEAQFLNDSEDFILKLFKNGHSLEEKYRTYIMNNLITKEKDKQISSSRENMPFIPGMQIASNSSLSNPVTTRIQRVSNNENVAIDPRLELIRKSKLLANNRKSQLITGNYNKQQLVSEEKYQNITFHENLECYLRSYY